MSQPVATVECRGIGKDLVGPQGTSTILHDIDLDVHAGASVAILGRSGSGKSTLLSLLGLLDRPSRGTFRLLGNDVASLSDAAAAAMRGAEIGFVFQRFFLLPRLTAVENVELALVHGRAPSGRKRRTALEALDRLGLADRATHEPARLSGGEQQRVAIARALVNRPALILADEPTGALDPATADGVVAAILAQAREQGAALVLVTHDAQVAARCERRTMLRDGHLREA